jgi:signal transduction histidine kinase
VLRRVLVAVVHECPGLTIEERAEGLGRTLDILDRSAQTSAAQYHAEALAAHEALEEKLRSADEQKDRFLAILAHELRNPLAGIQSALHLFRLRSHDPSLAQPLARADRQLRRMDRLIGDLLDISRISEGKLELRSQRLDLAGLIRETGEEHRAALSEVDLTLTLELPPEPVWAWGDPIRLAQVLDNLLTNAIKFTDPGGEVRVRLTVEAESRHAALSIRDNGIGLDPEMLPLVFDPFAQADGSQDRSRGGLGMGLALVKGLVDLHGGEIRAHSDGPGRGTEFTLRLSLEPCHSDSASSV